VPGILAAAKVHYVDSRKALSADERFILLAPIEDTAIGLNWDDARELSIEVDQLLREPAQPCRFATIPGLVLQPKSFQNWGKKLADHLYRTRRYRIFRSGNLGEYSQPGESERDFRIRLNDRAREQRDAEVEKLRQKYAVKLRSSEERVRRAEQAFEREQQEASSSTMETFVSFGATILGAVLGRKKLSSTNIGRASTTARDMGRMSRQKDDVKRAEQTLEAHRVRLAELEAEIAEEANAIADRFNPVTEPLETVELKPRKSDIDIRLIALGWTPCQQDAAGALHPCL
jgi:hypothetical protein